ncbi:MAG: GAF domain-containing protein [Myxococcota bacterium]
MKAPLPANEAERLKTLQEYQILGLDSDATLDAFTQLAAAICDTPMSTITLLGEHKGWLVSKVGLDQTESDRDVTFCAHTILQKDILLVEDAQKDSRFSDNPYVATNPGIRFYAGAPLIVENGAALGSLCVVDTRPKKLTPLQMNALNVLQKAVVTHLEHRRLLKELNALENLLPMCAWCRSIRNPDSSWTPLADYVSKSVPVSHAMCPNCAKNYGKS